MSATAAHHSHVLGTVPRPRVGMPDRVLYHVAPVGDSRIPVPDTGLPLPCPAALVTLVNLHGP